MPSAALTTWRSDRLVRLGRVEASCQTLMPPAYIFPTSGTTSPPPLPVLISPLAEESLQGLVMLLSGHFQGFCRDLYTECAQICAATVPLGLSDMVLAQFAAELKLDSMNPTVETIRKDFERFGFAFDLAGADPTNPSRITHLGHLNHWRNAIAHQRATSPSRHAPTPLTLANVQLWKAACDGLAGSLDGILAGKVLLILGIAPW